MYDPLTGNLDSRPAQVPDALERPRVADMVLGQYALVDIDAIWVDENGFATINKRCDLDDEESTEREFEYVSLVLLEQGLVVDAMGMEEEPEVRFVRMPLAELLEDDTFDTEDMLPIVWIVANAVEAAALKRLYKEQTGQDLYMPNLVKRPQTETKVDLPTKKRRFGARLRSVPRRFKKKDAQPRENVQEDL
jgi:hypothetical protein